MVDANLIEKILIYRKDGYSGLKIAVELCLHKSLVYRILKDPIFDGIKKKNNKQKRLSLFIKAEIKRLYDLNYTTQQIVDELNLTHWTITRYYRKYNFNKKGAKNYSSNLSPDQEIQIKKLIAEGYGRVKIAKIINSTEAIIRSYCRFNKIKTIDNKCLSKSTPEMISKILELHEACLNSSEISRKTYNQFKLSKHIIRKVLLKNGLPSVKPLTKEQIRDRELLKRIRKNFSKGVHRELRNNIDNKTWNNSFTKHVSYTISELKEHIEKQFEPWMNWDNWGNYRLDSWKDDDVTTWRWHIDHIVPVNSFIYTSMEDKAFVECWKLSNLRPLSGKENIIKGHKII
jgi:hypothetical protein